LTFISQAHPLNRVLRSRLPPLPRVLVHPVPAAAPAAPRRVRYFYRAPAKCRVSRSEKRQHNDLWFRVSCRLFFCAADSVFWGCPYIHFFSFVRLLWQSKFLGVYVGINPARGELSLIWLRYNLPSSSFDDYITCRKKGF